MGEPRRSGALGASFIPLTFFGALSERISIPRQSNFILFFIFLLALPSILGFPSPQISTPSASDSCLLRLILGEGKQLGLLHASCIEIWEYSYCSRPSWVWSLVIYGLFAEACASFALVCARDRGIPLSVIRSYLPIYSLRHRSHSLSLFYIFLFVSCENNLIVLHLLVIIILG